MVIKTKRPVILASVLVMLAAMANAQTEKRTEALSVGGSSAPVTVLESQGRTFVDIQELAKATGGSVAFEEDKIVLVLPRGENSTIAEDDAASRFSPAFRSSAIEAMASIREWGGMLMTIVRTGYPVGDSLAGNTLAAYEGRASDAIALASTVASTDSDNRGLELLKSEYSKVEAWSHRFVEARNSLHATYLSTSEHAINDDQDAQKAIRCGQFLQHMFANGALQENTECR